MGLYQYICEQEHRNDLVGELGCWILSHPSERPDHNSRAFELASEEFSACGNWTRQDAVNRLNENKLFQRIVKIEPRVSSIVSELLQIRNRQGYDRYSEYDRFKARIVGLVGIGADKESLANSESYDTMIRVIDDLLPPDASDLYKNGLPEDVELDL